MFRHVGVCCSVKQFGARFANETGHCQGDQSFNHANGQVNWDHERHKVAKRQFGNARNSGFQHHAKSTQGTIDHCRQHHGQPAT